MNQGGTNGLGGLFKFTTSSSTLSNILPFDKTTGYFSYNSELSLSSASLGLNANNLASKKVISYPNPSNDIFKINLDGIIKMTVFDINGKKLFDRKNTNSINLGKYKSGNYFLKIETEKDIFYSKLIKN